MYIMILFLLPTVKFEELIFFNKDIKYVTYKFMYIYIFISRFIFKKKFLQRIKIIEAVKKNNTKKMIDPVTTYLSHLLVKVYHLSTAKQKYISQAYENNKLFFLLLIHNSPCQILLSKSIGANNNMLV